MNLTEKGSQAMLGVILGERENDPVHDTPGIGHNLANESDLAREKVEALVANANKWGKEHAVITDAETAARCSDTLEQLSAWAKRLDEQRAAEKRPFLEAGRAVDARWHPIQKAVDACIALLSPIRRDWLQREDRRVKAERAAAQAAAAEARRKAEEAKRKAEAPRSVNDIIAASQAERAAKEATEAAAAMPQRAQVRGAVSGRVRSLTTRWHARIDDLVEATSHYLDHPALADLIEKLANADARGGVREIPGCTVYNTQE